METRVAGPGGELGPQLVRQLCYHRQGLSGLPGVIEMKDELLVAALLLSFATLVTTHVAIAVRLIWQAAPRYRGVVALLVPPLAPVWAYEQRWRRMCWLWVGSVGVYAAVLAVATL